MPPPPHFSVSPFSLTSLSPLRPLYSSPYLSTSCPHFPLSSSTAPPPQAPPPTVCSPPGSRMKRLPCPCLALPHFWLLGSHFMAQGSGTQAPGKGPSLSIQLLRAQYEGLRRQQRAQAHLVVLPKGRAGQVLGRRGGEEGPAVGGVGGWAAGRAGQGSASSPGGKSRDADWQESQREQGDQGRAALPGSVPLPPEPRASTRHLAGSLLFLASPLRF